MGICAGERGRVYFIQTPLIASSQPPGRLSYPMDLSEPEIVTINVLFTRLSDPDVRLPGAITTVYGDGNVAVGLSCDGVNTSGSAKTTFEAFVEARRGIETYDLCPVCYGASENCYPSPMALSMGYAERIYKLTPGMPGRIRDLVMIFDAGEDVHPSSVADQELYYQRWLDSPKSGSR